MGCEKLDIRECFTFIGTPRQRRSDFACHPTPTTDVAITDFTLIISTIIHNIIKSLSDIREFRLYTYDELPSLPFTLTTTYAYDTQPEPRTIAKQSSIYSYDALERNTHRNPTHHIPSPTNGIPLSSTPHLLYYNHRYYSPELGRWLSRDPIGDIGHLMMNPLPVKIDIASETSNPYRHTNNSPITYIDTDGQNIAILIGGGIIAIGIVAYEAWQIAHEVPNTIQNSNGSTSFVVHECEVVVVYGHGSATAPHTILQESNSLCGAGFIHCGATSSNNLVPASVLVPGAPTNTYFSGEVLPTDPEYQAASHAIQEGARAKANEICKKKDSDGCPVCKKVSVRFEYAHSGNSTTDLFDSAKPKSYTLKCACDE